MMAAAAVVIGAMNHQRSAATKLVARLRREVGLSSRAAMMIASLARPLVVRQDLASPWVLPSLVAWKMAAWAPTTKVALVIPVKACRMVVVNSAVVAAAEVVVVVVATDRKVDQTRGNRRCISRIKVRGAVPAKVSVTASVKVVDKVAINNAGNDHRCHVRRHPAKHLGPIRVAEAACRQHHRKSGPRNGRRRGLSSVRQRCPRPSFARCSPEVCTVPVAANSTPAS